MENHNLFKPKTLDEGRHCVVGDCNGFTTEQRWALETPLFAQEISKSIPPNGNVMDYGCGVGRIAKALLDLREDIQVMGVDESEDMLARAREYVDNGRFIPMTVDQASRCNDQNFDCVYSVYVFQHVPAIHIRSILSAIFLRLNDNGRFIYCSSDYRMAIRFDGKGFFDDRFLGVDLKGEVGMFFQREKDLFDLETINANPILGKMIRGDDGGLEHPAIVYRKR